MRAKHQKHIHSRKGLLRRAIAVGMAAAMIYTTALSCSALETMEVVDDATDLPEEVEFTEFDEDTTDEDDTLDWVEDELTLDDADDTEEADTPEDADEVQDDVEEPNSTDEEEEVPDESDEVDSKEEDAAKDEVSSDEDETADDEDFIDIGMLDEDEGEGEIALYAEPSNSITEAYYYDSADETDNGSMDRSNTSAFYSDEAHTIKIAGNITMQKFIEEYCASSATITMLSRYYVDSGTSETWKNVTLRRPKDKNAARIYGELTLDYGLKIEVPSDNDTGTGATLVVKSGGTLNIKNDALIKGCNDTAGQQGGVIYMIASGTINMEGGTLEGARVGDRGGAVYMSAGTFTMSGGTITDCQAQYGAGVYVAGGTFTMSGGTISGNTAKNGGGVYVSGGTFEMTGGIIGDEMNTNQGNTASDSGGGVCVTGGTFKMSGTAVISRNTANSSGKGGGGVFMSGGTFEMESGEVSDNTALRYGGGVTIWDSKQPTENSDTKFIMKGGIITQNHCARTSAVSVVYGIFKMENGTVVDNDVADNENGGTSVSDGKIIITGGSIDVIHNRNNKNDAVTKDGTEETKLTGYKIGGFAPGAQYSMDIEYTYNGVKDTYPCDNVYADDEGYIYPWLPKDSTLNGGTGDFPQISLTVPLSLVVNVSPTGDCVVTQAGTNEVAIGSVPIVTYTAESANSKIKNNSAVPVYLTEVTFTWNTDGGQTDDGKETPAPSAIFTNWSKKPILKLNNEEGKENENDNKITWNPNREIPANGTLELGWSFDLMGNSISQELQADTLAPIGTIMYTVSYQDPSKIGSTAA